MLYMVIEHFKDQDALAVYREMRAKGRQLPDGLRYVSSWIEVDWTRCFQVMETDDPALLARWITCWTHLAEFEVVPVMTSETATAAVAPLLDG